MLKKNSPTFVFDVLAIIALLVIVNIVAIPYFMYRSSIHPEGTTVEEQKILDEVKDEAVIILSEKYDYIRSEQNSLKTKQDNMEKDLAVLKKTVSRQARIEDELNNLQEVIKRMNDKMEALK